MSHRLNYDFGLNVVFHANEAARSHAVLPSAGRGLTSGNASAGISARAPTCHSLTTGITARRRMPAAAAVK